MRTFLLVPPVPTVVLAVTEPALGHTLVTPVARQLARDAVYVCSETYHICLRCFLKLSNFYQNKTCYNHTNTINPNSKINFHYKKTYVYSY